MIKTAFSRRSFLSGAGALVAMPTLIGSGCVSARYSKRPLPSERLNVGFIGYGTMGHDNMGNFLNNDRVQVVASVTPTGRRRSTDTTLSGSAAAKPASAT